MKIKVCGLNNPLNILELAGAGVDLFGFIFYKKSPRYYNSSLNNHVIRDMHHSIQKVGVFVNANEYEIMDAAAKYYLDYVQLHGDESPQLCTKLNQHVKVIKVFSVDNKLNKALMQKYSKVCDYFLLDTKTKLHGGSGKQFDWRALEDYDFKQPFFLSGGIGIEDVETIKRIKHPKLYGIDVNSKFEIVPGTKDTQLVKEFIKQINY